MNTSGRPLTKPITSGRRSHSRPRTHSLAHGQIAVVVALVEVDQAQPLVHQPAGCVPIGHRHAVAQQLVLLFVQRHQRLGDVVLPHLRQRLAVGLGRQARDSGASSAASTSRVSTTSVSLLRPSRPFGPKSSSSCRRARSASRAAFPAVRRSAPGSTGPRNSPCAPSASVQGAAIHRAGPSTKFARSVRSIWKGVMKRRPMPAQTFGILTRRREFSGFSWVTTVCAPANAWPTR
jgi:hypothetical protein